MPLSDTALRAAKPAEKPYRLFDGDGLYLEVSPAGGRLWRLKYRFEGKEKRLALGAYPEVGLKDARARKDEARKLLSNGVDPGEARKAAKSARAASLANSFEAVSIEWLARQKPKWSDSYYTKVNARLKQNVWPWIGRAPVADLRASAVLEVLRKIEDRNAHDMAGRVRETIGQVMRYAVATGRAEYDPTPSLKGALTAHVTRHMASVTDPVRVGEILRAFEAFNGTHTVKTALLLSPLLFARPGELRNMRWADLDLKAGLWMLPAARMKMRQEHIVPLPAQAIELINGMTEYSGHLEHVFPGARDPKRAMSDAAINAALRRLGIDTKEELTGHGFRAMARTILRERLGFEAEWIEAQLSHTKKGVLGAAYDRTQFLEQRTRMMAEWADYLDKLKQGAEIIPIPRRA